ncbi:type IV pilus twitching motility protein PilT [Cellulomonas sp. B6]|uniref:type IV pilus twitching motility protein PilT n=1 Tax=Cellulomonas sp. B6 TaxID=1295626 RepID=UPI0026845497|nr:PilT/PilU family type 4a pilus ATPase [Cellulomonas sp. B6]
MTEPYQALPPEPTRPLPPYRPAGPQATYSPVPSQSAGPQVPTQGAGPQVPAQAAWSAAPPPQAQGGPMPFGSVPAGPPVTPYGGAPTVPGARPVPTGLPVPAGPSAPPTVAPMPASQRTRRSEAPAAPVVARPAARAGIGQDRHEGDVDIEAVLRELVQLGGSDAHLTSGSPPMVRLSGALKPMEHFGTLTPDALRRSIYAILSQKQRETFEENLELDFSHAVRGLARFRVNLYVQRESVGAAFRVIPYEIKPLEELGVPPVVGTFAGLPRGLVLVTGPTGSGKSTTLASIVDLANRTREDHIMTVEDPIEFLHRHKKSIINQREVGADTHSFANALKHVLRQDPDIILVGEMRDLETISVALTAAETGHLVFATLHTQDAAQTIDRVIDVFPSHQQAQVRTQLAGAIQAVVCQTLCRRHDGQGRAVATEVMVATPAIRNLIREGKTHQIYSAMQAGAKQGMHTMDQHLADLVRSGRISYEVGLEKCHHVEDFNRLTGRFSGQSQAQAGVASAAGGFGGQVL